MIQNFQVQQTMGQHRVQFIVDQFKYDESIVPELDESLPDAILRVFVPRIVEDLPEAQAQESVEELTQRIERLR